MKTLYISDLDGTLLNKNVAVSEFTKNTLNSLIKKGMNFTVATARISTTSLQIMKSVNLLLPIVLMNGAVIYDVKNQKNIKTQLICKSSAHNIFMALKEYNLSGFLYTTKNNNLYTYYENLDTKHRRNFYNERTKTFGKIITKVEDFESRIEEDILYFSTCDKKENLKDLYENLKRDTKLNVECYRDIYLEDYWYIEISSEKASKYYATCFLKENYNFDEVISFGDNFNDISMFKASTRSLAVENAKKEVKDAATNIIKSNEDNGVANYLLENFNN